MPAAFDISVTTGHIKCGISANWLISTIFGSTKHSFNSSGRLVYSQPMMMVFMHTLLPLPVVPAINMCGILARSSTSGSPAESFPRNIGSTMSLAWPPLMSSFNITFSFWRFGTSMPMDVRPTMFGKMRMFGACKLRAISEAMVCRRATRVPGASSTEYSVTTGPLSIPVTAPSI